MAGKLVLMIVVVFTVAGCLGPVAFTRLTDEAYPPGQKEKIEVFIGETPPRRYTRIARITTNLPKGNFAANLDLIKRQAAELGADGVILVSAQRRYLGTLPFSGIEISAITPQLERDTGYSYSAYAIRYLTRE